jgi:hypothetical protein
MHHQHRNSWLFCLLATVLGGFPINCYAAANEGHWIELRILSRQTGEAVSDAAVCLGTTARPDQFGARRSDADGSVRFEGLGGNRVLITVSKAGYQGRQQSLEANHQNRILELKIAPGGGGPRCDVPATASQVDTSSGLAIEKASVRSDPSSGSPGLVQISVTVSGKANQIRVSEKPDFAGAAWQAFRRPLAYTLSPGSGLKQIHIQVRRFSEVQGASVEVISPVRTIKYRRP